MNSFKYLYIVRHGKSIQNYGDISDIDRPLTERGVIDGYTMAERLLDQEKKPEKIISSPAVRALHSATIFARTFNFSYNEIIVNKNFYLAETNIVLDTIKQTVNNINSLMIFGHNPTFTDLANYFLKNEIDNIPTTGIVELKLELNSWSEIDQVKALESFFDYPKNIH